MYMLINLILNKLNVLVSKIVFLEALPIDVFRHLALGCIF